MTKDQDLNLKNFNDGNFLTNHEKINNLKNLFKFEGEKYEISEIEYGNFSDAETYFNRGKKLIISREIPNDQIESIFERIKANKVTPEDRRHILTIQEFYTARRNEFLSRSKETANFYFEFRYLKAIIRIYNPQNKLMLDAGCGVGRLTIPLLELGHNILGVDITPSLIESAKNQNRSFANRFEIGNLNNLQYNDESFQIIFMMWHVISDLNDNNNTLEKTIAEVSRCISDEGILVFDIPDKTSDNISKYYEGKDNDNNFQEFLAKIPELEYLNLLLNKVGFEKIRNKHFNWGIHKYVFIYQKKKKSIFLLNNIKWILNKPNFKGKVI